MSILHVTQIRKTLEKLLAGKIDVSDLPQNAPLSAKEDAFSTRALVAYAVSVLSGDDADVVAPCVTDGFGDTGLDLIYFAQEDRRLYLAQSKFSKSGDSGLAEGDFLKFLSGVEALLAGDFDRFANNKRIVALRDVVQQALEDTSTKIVLVLAHTSVQPLSAEITRHIKAFLAKINDSSEIAEFEELAQGRLHAALAGGAEGAPIKLDAMVTEWGQIKEPYQAYYGQINAADVAQWYAQHKDRLFSKNIRKALGKTDANRQIVETARSNPEHFWYFNNGITVLCQSISKKLLGGGAKASAVLECQGVTIVNGAQTVASIAAANDVAPDAVKRASIPIRFISLQHGPADFSIAVTRATNVQNRIENRDFAALDPAQERLRRELWLDGKVYAYKTGESTPAPDAGCTMEDAATALACSSRDISLSVLIKSTPGRIWEGIDSPKSVYRRLFTDKTTGTEVWRRVEIMRAIDDAMRQEQKTRFGVPDRMVVTHGNRFIAQQVMLRLNSGDVSLPTCDIEGLKKAAQVAVPVLANETIEAVKRLFPNAYVQSLFKSATKCVALATDLVPSGAKVVPYAKLASAPTGVADTSPLGAAKTIPGGQSGPSIDSLDPNVGEVAVARALAHHGGEQTLAELARLAFPTQPHSQANSWVRNALRRLMRAGWAERVKQGMYRVGRRNPYRPSVASAPADAVTNNKPIASKR